MSPLIIVDKIRKAGGLIWGEDGDIRIVGIPVGILTPEDKSILAENKDDLVPLLSRPTPVDDPVEREAIIWAETAPTAEVREALDQALAGIDQIVGSDQQDEFVDQDLAENTIEAVPCDDCGELERWEDLAGGWHCSLCEPPLRAHMLRLQVRQIRRRLGLAGPSSTGAPMRSSGHSAFLPKSTYRK